jgi:hypothetical protein
MYLIVLWYFQAGGVAAVYKIRYTVFPQKYHRYIKTFFSTVQNFITKLHTFMQPTSQELHVYEKRFAGRNKRPEKAGDAPDH